MIEEKEATLKARQKAVSAARQQLTNLVTAKRNLMTKLEGIEAKLQMIEATQGKNEFNFDDSALSRAKQTVADLEKRLEVKARAPRWKAGSPTAACRSSSRAATWSGRSTPSSGPRSRGPRPRPGTRASKGWPCSPGGPASHPWRVRPFSLWLDEATLDAPKAQVRTEPAGTSKQGDGSIGPDREDQVRNQAQVRTR